MKQLFRPNQRSGREYIHALLFALGTVPALYLDAEPDIGLLIGSCAALLLLLALTGMSLVGRMLVPILDLASGLAVALTVLAFAANYEMTGAARTISLLLLFLFILCGLSLAVRSCEFSGLLSKRLMPESSFRAKLRVYTVLSAIFLLVSSSLLLLFIRLVCGEAL